jgi:hypothetical protein
MTWSPVENQEKDTILRSERNKSKILEERVQELMEQSDSTAVRIQLLDEKEKSLTERSRELVRLPITCS